MGHKTLITNAGFTPKRGWLAGLFITLCLFLHSVPAASQRVEGGVVALKTNLLYDAVALPSVGVEVYLGAGWTLAADWTYAWWRIDSRNFCHQAYGGYAGVRKYFGKQSRERRFSGHHLGLYGSGLTYDFQHGGKGYQAARWGFGGGLEYGYSIPIGKSLNLDLSVGVGYQDGEYKTYTPQDGHFVWQGTYIRQWVGPTKAEVSLVWIIGKKRGK